MPVMPLTVNSNETIELKYDIPSDCFNLSPQSTNEEILTLFFRLNADFLQQIEDQLVDPAIFQSALSRLWDTFINDERCPTDIKENSKNIRAEITIDSPAVQNVISIQSRLSAVINNDRVIAGNAAFAKAVEAVAIAWSFPQVMDQAGITADQKAAFTNLTTNDQDALFEAAVNWMRKEPGCVDIIQNYYVNDLKPSGVSAIPENRANMLKNLLPACAKAINKTGDLGRLFNKGSIKKIEELATATSLKNIINAIPSEISNPKTQENLEEYFLEKAKLLLNTLLADFQNLFPDPTFFDLFSDQFSESWKDSNLSVNAKRNNIIAGLMVFETFNLEANILATEGQSINYWYVAELGNAISSFLRGFAELPEEVLEEMLEEMPEEQENINFYTMFQKYINIAGFPSTEQNSSSNNNTPSRNIYDAFPGTLSEDMMTTFTDKLFTKLSSQGAYNSIIFDQMLMMATSTDTKIFASTIVQCIGNAGEQDINELRARLDALLRYDSALFMNVAIEASKAVNNLEQVDVLLAQAVELTKNNPELLAKLGQDSILPYFVEHGQQYPLRILLYYSAQSSQLAQFGQHFTEASLEFQHETREREKKYREVFLKSLDEKVDLSMVLDEGHIQRSMERVLSTLSKSTTSSLMLRIWHSGAPLFARLQLIGAIAFGEDDKNRIFSNPISKDGRLYQHLKRFNDLNSYQEIDAFFSNFLNDYQSARIKLQTKTDSQVTILLRAGQDAKPGKGGFARHFQRWMQFCENTGCAMPLDLGWSGDSPDEAEKWQCKNIMRELKLEGDLKTACERSFNNACNKKRITSVDAHTSASQHSSATLAEVLKASGNNKSHADFSEERNIITLLNIYENSDQAEKNAAKQRIDTLIRENIVNQGELSLIKQLANISSPPQRSSIFTLKKSAEEGPFEKLAAKINAINIMRPSYADILVELKQIVKEHLKETPPTVNDRRIHNICVAVDQFFHPGKSRDHVFSQHALMPIASTSSPEKTIEALVKVITATNQKPIVVNNDAKNNVSVSSMNLRTQSSL